MRLRPSPVLLAGPALLLMLAGCSSGPNLPDGGDHPIDTAPQVEVPICSEALRDQLGYINDDGESVEFPIQGWLTIMPPDCYFAMVVDGEAGGYALYAGDQVEAINANLSGIGFSPTADGAPGGYDNGTVFTYAYVPSQVLEAGEGIPDALVGTAFTSFSAAEDLD